ncbi:MAG: hypothetical protein L6Q57_07415 [Alphaproteobacteria bacterium]|nr:hypothetical protein [Alphaproteobacteria bacterium]
MSRISLPTAEEIGGMLHGWPVILVYPKDIPHHRPSAFHPYSESELADRTEYLRKQIIEQIPYIGTLDTDDMSENIKLIAGHFGTAALIMNSLSGPRLLMLMPSKTTQPRTSLSNEISLPIFGQFSGIPKDHQDYIEVLHEIGHCQARNERVSFQNPYQEELYADTFAINSYLDAGGSLKTAKDYILKRALVALFTPSPRYWLAQNLAARFIDNREESHGYEDVWLQGLELKTRLNKIMNSFTSLCSVEPETNYDSNGDEDSPTIRKRILTEYSLGDDERGIAEQLKPFRVSYDTFTNEHIDIHIKPRVESFLFRMFKALEIVIRRSPACSEVKSLGVLAIHGAVRFMPNYVPCHYIPTTACDHQSPSPG